VSSARPARSHTAVVENKRLSHALTLIKAQQEQDTKDQPKVKTKSEKGGYQKRARKIYGLPEEQLNDYRLKAGRFDCD
jgi:hypothetical protein